MSSKKILITGYSGFLGRYVLDYLQKKHTEIIKLGRDKNSDVKWDLSSKVPQEINAEIVIHIAGKAHSIPKTKKDIEHFFDVNFHGTIKLVESLNLKKLKSFIFISTVAVYGLDNGNLVDESYPLLGSSPYSLSKIKAEKYLVNFGKTNNINIVILRLPLITGANPIGNLKHITDAIKKRYYFRIGNGTAKRSIVSANDVAKLIPHLFNLNGIYNLTDCNHPMIRDIDSTIAANYNREIRTLPLILMKLTGKVGDILSFLPFNSLMFNKLTENLTFSNQKLINEIEYRPTNGLSDII